MIKIGLTGGIGSGKTTVCKIFEQLGIPVFYADEEAKKILQSKAVGELLIPAFGNSVVDKDGKVNRAVLAAQVFNDESKLKKLNAIIHPEVAKVFNNWLEKNNKSEYIVKEAAILFESGADKALDKTISVNAPDELRVERVMSRDNVPKESVLQRMQNQLTDDERSKLADYIIVNDEKKAVIPQVLMLHKAFMELALNKIM